MSTRQVEVDSGAVLRLLDTEPFAIETLWAYAAMRANNVDQQWVLTVAQEAQQWVEHITDPAASSIYAASLPVTERRLLPDAATDDDLVRIGYVDAPLPDPSVAGPWSEIDGCLSVSEGAVRLSWDDNGPNSECVLIAVEFFQRLLQTVLGGSESPIGNMQLVTSDELARIAAWNDTAIPQDDERALIALFDEAVVRSPGAPAVEVAGEATSYADLNAMSGQLAQLLVGRGIGPGDAVALCVERSLVMTAAMLAILRSGAAYVPIDPAYPNERQLYMISDSGARVVLADGANASRLGPSTPVDVIELSETDLSGEITEKPQTTAAETPPAMSPASASEPGYVIYTSGSTGLPKGVVMPQRALTNLVEWQLRRPQARLQARTLQFSALSFDVSFQEIYSTWASGGTLVLISESARRDAGSLLDSLIDAHIGRLFLPFVALRALAQTAVRTGRYPTSLREVYTAGEQLQVDETVRTFFASLPQCVLENQYGPSETHVCSAHTLQADPTNWPMLPPIGGPIANCGMHVLDKWGEPRPIGMTGELYVSGQCLADRYVGKAEMTAERFVEVSVDGQAVRCYRTGDIVRWLETGALEFLGRADNQVKLRGFRVEPGEVTAVLSAAPGVKQCVAVVRDDVGGSTPRMVGYIVPDDPEAFDLAAVQQYTSAKMPEYMVPTHWALLATMPMTPSGKLDQKALPMPAFDRDTLDSPYVAPQGARQETLAAIWSELLGVDNVGVNDNFFDLGGDSLLAVEMMTLIHERLALDLPLGALARTRTIAELDAVADGELGSVWGSLVPLRESGDRTPLFMVHGGTGNVATYPLVVERLPDNQPVYALQWDGLDGSRGTRTIEAMADLYVREIRSVQASGPYQISGQCIGGLVAREIAARLENQGEVVNFVIMYDTPHLRTPAFFPRRIPFLVYQFKRTFTSGDSPVQRMRTNLRMWLGRSIPVADRTIYCQFVMIKAARSYQFNCQPQARTIFIGSNTWSASDMGLVGHWDDHALGWLSHKSDRFEVLQTDSGHNDVPYHPEAMAKLLLELDRGVD